MSVTVKNTDEWRQCLQYMSRRVKPQSFNTWLKGTRGNRGTNGDFNVVVPNEFVAGWIREHFQPLIDESLKEVLGSYYTVSYVIDGVLDDSDQVSLDLYRPDTPTTSPVRSDRPKLPHNLNRKYNFASLVVGGFNQFATAASGAVAEDPGTTSYNPLYIYGGTGLGKTHIAQAIGNRILEKHPDKQVLYVTSEKFTSDFIVSVSNGSISTFTHKYRDVDVLIVDDIQFFAGKESTQEQFFHTFNTLYHLGKQIVLSSDRSPKDIKGLEERLLSRFSWGLVTDIQPPDVEGRLAILQKKLKFDGATLPDNVIAFLADKVTSNIRDLEGALTRLLAYSSLRGVAMNVETASRVLADTIHVHRKKISINRIKEIVSDHFSIDPNLLAARKKTTPIVQARQVAMYLSRKLTDNSLKAIGGEFGGRDHSTVLHSCDMITKKMAGDQLFKETIERLSASLVY